MPTLHDLEVRRQVYLQRYKAQLSRDMDGHLTGIAAAVVAVLRSLQDENMQDIPLMPLVRRINQAQAPLWAEARRYLDGELRELAEDEAEYEAQALEQQTPAEEIAVVAAALILIAANSTPMVATGQTLDELLTGWQQNQSANIVRTIRSGWAKGATVSEVIRDILGTKYRQHKDGVMNKVRNATDATTDTAAQHVAATATAETWSRNKVKLTDAIDLRYRWLSVLDARTTVICRSLSNRIFVLGQGPLPPMHPRCRSTIMYDNGENPQQFESYYDWLATQSADFQDDAIGPKRAQLFREGGLTHEQFAKLNLGRNFEPLTLKEMRQRRPNAFAEADL